MGIEQANLTYDEETKDSSTIIGDCGVVFLLQQRR
jgi:hypothetical protein